MFQNPSSNPNAKLQITRKVQERPEYKLDESKPNMADKPCLAKAQTNNAKPQNKSTRRYSQRQTLTKLVKHS